MDCRSSIISSPRLNPHLLRWTDLPLLLLPLPNPLPISHKLTHNHKPIKGQVMPITPPPSSITTTTTTTIAPPKADLRLPPPPTKIRSLPLNPSEQSDPQLGSIPTPMTSSGAFATICVVHATVAVTCGSLMMFFLDELATVGFGSDTAVKLRGSTPHDQLLLETSDSFAGLLLFTIGLLLFMVSFVKDRDFQGFFARGCVLLHASMALWRVHFEGRVEELAGDWPRQLVGDVVLAVSWVIFLVHSWREEYD